MNRIVSYSNPIEFKIVALRECPLPAELAICDQPALAVEYWKAFIEPSAYFNPECECFIALHLNIQRRIKAHQMISIGTLDSIHSHPREVFRGAVVGSAHSIILLHNHPSGDPTPSDCDIRTTRDLVRAGQLLKIDVVDHIIIGRTAHSSLRELGFLNI
jgi:DNA repair protein RadC